MFIAEFESKGGKFLGQKLVTQAGFNGVDAVDTELDDGTQLQAEKLLVAQGRVSSIDGLNIDAAGVAVTDMKLITVNSYCQTNVPHIYAIGDVIGPPSLASSSMEQGRRAACHALGFPKTEVDHSIPIGIFSIPELAAVGLTEVEARSEFGDVIIGIAEFKEVARGLIAGEEKGILKMIADPRGEQLLGVHIAGEGAAELIHLGQMGMITGMEVNTFVEQVFNFPTLAEAYRVAALSITGQAINRQLGSVRTVA